MNRRKNWEGNYFISLFLLLAPLFYSCDLISGTKSSEVGKEKIFLGIRVVDNAKYHYTFDNKVVVTVDGQESGEQKSINATDIEMLYEVVRDTNGYFKFISTYESIKISNNTNGQESIFTSENEYAGNLTDKMLGILKKSQLVAIVKSNGEIQEIQGYEELASELMKTLQVTDINSRAQARKELDRIIGTGIVKKSYSQLFDFFPDSTIRVGDKWTVASTEIEEYGLTGKTIYTFKDITDHYAHLESKTDLTNKNSGQFGTATFSNLNADYTSKYAIELETGIVSKVESKGKIVGKLKSAISEAQITIKIESAVTGKRVN